MVELVDLPAFGRPARLVWRKHRWSCVSQDCPAGSWTEEVPAIAAARLVMTDRAGRWVTEQVGRWGRTVNEVAVELGCDWHTVNDTVIAYGTALVDDDPDRIGGHRPGPRRDAVRAPGPVAAPAVVDLHRRRPRRPPARRRPWSQRRRALCRGSPLEDRTGWTGIDFATLDLSGPYRSVFDTMLPDATQVADPFHLVKLANATLDECRRRVQNETLGHRGRKHDPLYRCRRLLTKADERLDDKGRTKLLGLLDAGDPRGEVDHRLARQGGGAGALRPSPIPTSPSSGSPASATTCRTQTARPRSAASAARSSAGGIRSPPGTRPT